MDLSRSIFICFKIPLCIFHEIFNKGIQVEPYFLRMRRPVYKRFSCILSQELFHKREFRARNALNPEGIVLEDWPGPDNAVCARGVSDMHNFWMGEEHITVGITMKTHTSV